MRQSNVIWAIGASGFTWTSTNGEGRYGALRDTYGWNEATSYTNYPGLADNDEFLTAWDNLFVELEAISSDLSAWMGFWLTVLPDATMQSMNLINPGTYDITWTSMTSNDQNGADFNGVNARGDTGIAADATTLNDVHLGFWVNDRADADTGLQYLIGARGASNSELLALFIRNSTVNQFMDAYNATASQGRISGDSDRLGYVSASRRSSTDQELYNDGVSLDTNTGTVAGTRPTVNLHLGQRWQGSVAQEFNGVGYAADIGARGFTDAEELAVYTALNNFFTDLGI